MNSGQVEPYLAHDNLRDQVISEWVKTLGILLGIGLVPLLFDMAEMPTWLVWIAHRFWLPSLIAGLLTILIGVIYHLRQVAYIRRRQAAVNSLLVLEEGKLPPRDIRVQTNPFTPLSSQSEINLLVVYIRLGRAYSQVLTNTSLGWLEYALTQPEMEVPFQTLDEILSQGTTTLRMANPPKLAEFLKEIPHGKQSRHEHEKLNRLAVFGEILSSLASKLQNPGWQAGEALAWIVERLDYSHVLEIVYGQGNISRQKIESVVAFIDRIRADRIPAQALPEWVEASVQAPSDTQLQTTGEPIPNEEDEAAYIYLNTPTFMIALGIMILLPALIGFWVQQSKLENQDLIQRYFSTPVIFLWVATEAVNFYLQWQADPKETWQWVGLLKSGLQLAGALVLWGYLGSFFGLMIMGKLFWLATGLAGAGALLGNLAVWLQQRSETKRPGKAADQSQSGNSDHLVPTARFQVFGKHDKYYFYLQAGRKKKLLTSEGYATLENCLIDIILVRLLMKKDAALDEHFQRLTKAGRKRQAKANPVQYYFVLKHGDHTVIGTSETFSDDDLEREIRSVQELAPTADIKYLP